MEEIFYLANSQIYTYIDVFLLYDNIKNTIQNFVLILYIVSLINVIHHYMTKDIHPGYLFVQFYYDNFHYIYQHIVEHLKIHQKYE